jgi:hypothetical protein
VAFRRKAGAVGVGGGVSDEDVIVAILGAAGGAAGFVLVFFGFLVTTIRSFPSGTSDSVLLGFRVLASLIAVAFLLGVATVAQCVAWLAGDQGHGWYTGSLVVFVCQLALLVVSALWVLGTLVWKD